jgi:hypothetical protein
LIKIHGTNCYSKHCPVLFQDLFHVKWKIEDLC